jgi:hypothetical protein
VRRQLGRAREVVRRAGRRFIQDDELGRAAAEAHGKRGGQPALGVQMALELRQLLGHAKSGATGEDRDLGDGIGMLGERGDQSVPGLMDGDGVLLLGTQRARRVAAAD